MNKIPTLLKYRYCVLWVAEVAVVTVVTVVTKVTMVTVVTAGAVVPMEI